jgi:hypothetical protein
VGQVPKQVLEAELAALFRGVTLVDEVTVIRDRPPGSREVWIRTPPSLVLPSHLSNSFALPRCNVTPHLGAGPTGSQDLGRGFAWNKLDRGDGGMLSPSARLPLGMDSLLWRARLCGC